MNTVKKKEKVEYALINYGQKNKIIMGSKIGFEVINKGQRRQIIMANDSRTE